MHQVEITDIPPLSAGEVSIANLHSVLNVVNVLRGELTMVGIALADDEDFFKPALSICDRIREDLVDPAASLAHAGAMHALLSQIDAALATGLRQFPSRTSDPSIIESLDNLHSTFRVLETRAREILARSRAPEKWEETSVDSLKAEFLTFLTAIEKNSRGRFGIVYNLASQGTNDYLVQLNFEAQSRRLLNMPAVFKDVMRDLIANARKYTPSGGMITAGLVETDKHLRFVVKDTGRGIPGPELQSVVHFGKRGSNVGEVRTLGGGFGLTKAFLVTKQFGGRIWIQSEIGAGTQVTIEIPRPNTGANRSCVKS